MIPRLLRDLCWLALTQLFAGASIAQSNHYINFVFLNGIKNTYADASITSSTIRPISRSVVDRVNSVCPAFDPAKGGTPLRRQPPSALWNPTGGFAIDTLEVKKSKVLEEALIETSMFPPDPLELGHLRALAVQASQTLNQEESAVLDVISEGSKQPLQLGADDRGGNAASRRSRAGCCRSAAASIRPRSASGSPHVNADRACAWESKSRRRRRCDLVSACRRCVAGRRGVICPERSRSLRAEQGPHSVGGCAAARPGSESSWRAWSG